MTDITVEIGADGVAVATFDAVGRAMNTISYAVQDELGALAERVRADDAIKGLVLRSGKATGFCAGADLPEMEGAIARWRRASGQDALRAGVESAGSYSRHVRAIEACGKPVATIVHGVALGGGLELALAGHRRFATGNPASLRLGFPEATIGLMPGAGGTQRLPRLMGIAQALPYLLDGQALSLDAALESGILHAHIDKEDAALESARKWVADNPDSAQPWDAKGYRITDGPHSPSGYNSFPYLIANVLADAPNDHAARANILRAVYEGTQLPIDAALRVESRYFFNTVRAPTSGAMVRTLFAAKQAVAKRGRADPAPFRALLSDAWTQSAQRLLDNGTPARLVSGVARSLSRHFPEIVSDKAAHAETDLPDPTLLHRITRELLKDTAQAAQTALENGLVGSREEADIAGIECGYPAWTGGPISFLDGFGNTAGEAIRQSTVSRG